MVSTVLQTTVKWSKLGAEKCQLGLALKSLLLFSKKKLQQRNGKEARLQLVKMGKLQPQSTIEMELKGKWRVELGRYLERDERGFHHRVRKDCFLGRRRGQWRRE